MPSSRLGPTDKYDGDAQMRKSSAGALHRGAALRLFPFASSVAVLKRILFLLLSPYSYPAAQGTVGPPGILAPFLQHRPLSVHSSHRARHCHVCFHLFSVRTGTRQVKGETLADYRSRQAAASLCVPHDFCHFSTLCAGPTAEKFFFFFGHETFAQGATCYAMRYEERKGCCEAPSSQGQASHQVTQ